jgi:aspartyl-tRNA(Asn)/glutamyl-tRNA(Gln) amidotransferase subunit A
VIDVAALRRGEVSAVELAERALARAEEVGAAFVQLAPALALELAKRADGEIRRGRYRGPLHGLPLAVKDVIDVAGLPTRLGTPRAGHRMPMRNAAAVHAAVQAGAVVIGKTATHELALGMTTPAVGNPVDPTRTAGGSSGGSAAAVASGVCTVALGTDTNGSVRCPAALCGVVGLKPTFGSVSREGVAPLAWSQDTVGSFGATVADCAALHDALAPLSEDWSTSPSGMRIGIDRELCATADPAVAEAVLAAVGALRADGVQIVELSLPKAALAGAASFVTIMAEASRAWSEAVSEAGALCPETRAALRAGATVSADAYLRAAQVRTLVRQQLADVAALKAVQAVVLPTVPVVASLRGAATVQVNGRERPVEAAHAQFTALASLIGYPALSVPCGLHDGLPIGLQLIGAPGSEADLLRLGAAVELRSALAALSRLPTTKRP